MSELLQDVTYAIRKLRAAPTFAITAVLTLAFGIGAHTTVLNLVNAALFAPPPVRDVSTLAWAVPRDKRGRYSQWSFAEFEKYRVAAKSWSGIAAFSNMDVTVGGKDPEHVTGQIVSASYFTVLGVRVAPGRAFVPAEDTASAMGSPVVLGHLFWLRRFGADSAVLGQSISVNGSEMTVVGIAPEGFNGLRAGDDISLYVPFGALRAVYGSQTDDLRSANAYWLSAVGRLAPGVRREAAAREGSLLVVALDVPVGHEEPSHKSMTAESATSRIGPEARKKAAPILGILMIIPLLVLGVACANVANLFMARSVQREREIAVRRALGAGRGRVIRQLLTECVVLGLIAGAAGMVVSRGLTAVIIAMGNLPSDVTDLLHPDARVVTMTLLIAIAAGVTFGLLPSLSATRLPLVSSLKGDAGGTRVGHARHRLRTTFVVSQVALSLALLITAALFVQSARRALTSSPGFDPRNAVSAWYDVEAQSYDSTRARAFARNVLERLAADPDVESATIARALPLSRTTFGSTVRRADVPAPDQGSTLKPYMTTVVPGYFRAMRVPLLRGRDFNANDVVGAPRVVIVNEQLASRLWGKENPIGKSIVVGGDSVPRTVIGLAQNGKYRTLAEELPESFFWTPAAQAGALMRAQIMVRSRTSTAAAMRAANRAVAAVAPSLPLFRANTLQALLEDTVGPQRAGGAVVGLFGVLALALAALGIFGVIAHGVASRTKEIGIRMSLGAHAATVVRQFVREGLKLTALGAVIGVALSLAASKVLGSFLYGLSGADLPTFAGAVALLSIVALLASFVPARRAARVDPLTALRAE
jgi:predicted permease